MTTEFTHGLARTDDGATIAYKVAGAGDVALVFMPGWGSTKDYFDETIKLLDLSTLKVVVFDPRGHGDSPEGPDNYASERQAKDMLAVAHAAGIDKFVSCGHSMAGKYIQLLPVLAPKRILGQILVAGMPAGALPVDNAVLEEWAGYSGNRDAMRASHHAIITRPIPHAVSEKWIAQAASISRHVLYMTLETCFRDDISPFVARTSGRIPTLVIAARHDPFFPVELMKEQLADKIRGARMVVLDCGHEIPNEMPAETAMLIESFSAASLPTNP